MTDQTTICNLAVMHIGEEHVTNIDEASKAAVALKVVWQTLVDEMLEEYDWTFARQRQSLALLSAAPAFGFNSAFKLPSDYLRMPQNQDDCNAWSDYPWRKEGNMLLTNETAIDLLYIARVGPEKFSAKFAVALSYRLAAAVAFVLSKKGAVVKQMWDLYLLKLAEAQSADAAQMGRIDKPSRWLNARR
jgi:hypothetical protein